MQRADTRILKTYLFHLEINICNRILIILVIHLFIFLLKKEACVKGFDCLRGEYDNVVEFFELHVQRCSTGMLFKTVSLWFPQPKIFSSLENSKRILIILSPAQVNLPQLLQVTL